MHCDDVHAVDSGLAQQLEQAIDATRVADHDTRIGRLVAARVEKPAELHVRSARAAINEQAVDIAAAEDVVDPRSSPPRTVDRDNADGARLPDYQKRGDNEFQRGHDVGYSEGFSDGRRVGIESERKRQAEATPAPIKFSAGRPEPRKNDQECWLGHEWGDPNDAACEQEVKQVAVMVSVLVSLPKADDCSFAVYVHAAVDAIQRTFPQAAILLDNDTKQRGLNPMVDGGHVLMPDFFCRQLEPRHDAQCDFAAQFGGGA